MIQETAQEPNLFWVVLALALPGEFAQYLFERHWLSIEIVSLLLLVAVIGALLLAGRAKKKPARGTIEGEL